MMRGEIYSELTFKAIFLGLLNSARANTALVRMERSLSARVRGYLPPHNFTVRYLPWVESNISPHKTALA